MIMAAVALLRSVASKMARAPPTHRRPLLARGIHGGARPGPGGSLTPPPTSNEGKRDRFVVGMAATAGLRFLATKLPRAPPSAHHRLLLRRGLRAASYSTSPPTQMDIRTTHSKVRAGPAYIMIFGLLVYMYGRVLPALNKLNKLEDKLKSRSRKMSNLNDKLTQAMEAIELLLAESSYSEAQSSENGKDDVSVTGKGRLNKIEKTHRHFKELETAIRDLESEITELKDLESEMAKLKIALESARSKENV